MPSEENRDPATGNAQKLMKFAVWFLRYASGQTNKQRHVHITILSNSAGDEVTNQSINQSISQQEAFEKCWAHSLLRAASRPFTRSRQRYCRTPPVHRCPRRQRRQRRQRQRVTEGTAMAPWNGPN